MQHEKVEVPAVEQPLFAPDRVVPEALRLLVADRVIPRWVAVLGALFQTASSICILALTILCTYLIELPGDADSFLAAALFGVVGVFLVLGSIALDAAQNHALRGYRVQREAVGSLTGCCLGALVALVLFAVHPLLGLGPGLAVMAALLLRRQWMRTSQEQLWEPNRHEAAGFLSGRDTIGFSLASRAPDSHALSRPSILALSWLALVLTFATGSALRASTILSPEAVPALALLAYWATGAVAGHLLRQQNGGRSGDSQAQQVTQRSEVEASTEIHGLDIRGLKVTTAEGKELLSNLEVLIEPGKVVGLIGASGAGKSLLLQTLQDPYALAGLRIEGAVRLNRHALWKRTAEPTLPISVLLPQEPLLLATSGLNNLTFCQPELQSGRGLRLLERLVFSADDVATICAAEDARRLPGQQRKLLAFARALLLSPELYLLDRPEDGLADRNIGALCEQIASECRLGRCFLIVTENRQMLELCDEVIVMESGRIVDRGPSGEVRERMTAGWSRLVADRRLESEENLTPWIRNLFKRPGDELNRKMLTSIASELLVFSCQTAEMIRTERLVFEFMHKKGYCLLRLIDEDDPPTTATLKRARVEVENGFPSSSLAMLLNSSQSFNCTVENNKRVITLQIKTYDPRMGAPPPAERLRPS